MAIQGDTTLRPLVLVVGRTGQIATSLRAISDDDIGFLCLGRGDGLDITKPELLRAVLEAHRPEFVVNAAAYTSVDRAESAADAAFAVNADGPATLARFCAERGLPIIHISTDYVFDGQKGSPYTEDDPMAPVNVYGASKAAGETAIRDQTGQYLILRTSWLYSPFGSNFVKTMIGLAKTHEEIGVVADQRGCPTSAEDVAAAIRTIIGRLRDGSESYGVFHVAGTDSTTWFDFAGTLFALNAARGRQQPQILPITTAQYAAAASRPPDSRLCCDKIADAYGLTLPSWRNSLKRVLTQIQATTEAKV